MATPAQVTEQARSADRQGEKVVQQILGLAQGDAEVGSAVAGQQPRSRADVRTRQLQVPAALTGLLAATAAVQVAAVAMPLELGFGNIGHEMVSEPPGRFQIARTAMRTLLGMHIMFDKNGAGWGLRPKEPRVFAVFLATPVQAATLGVVAAVACAFVALVNLLQFVLQLRQPTPQLRVFRYSGPPEVDHSGHLHLLRLFPSQPP